MSDSEKLFVFVPSDARTNISSIADNPPIPDHEIEKQRKKTKKKIKIRNLTGTKHA